MGHRGLTAVVIVMVTAPDTLGGEIGLLPFWRYGTRELIEWAKKMADFGAGELLITSMDRDGTKKGFDNNLMKSISDAVDIPIIASGGAGSLRHLVDGIKEGEADAVLAASIFHYGEYSIKEAKKYMHEHGIEMRL